MRRDATVREKLAGNTCSRPTILQARHPLLIKPDGTGVCGDATNEPPVHHSKNHERCDRNEKQQIGRIEVAQPEQDPGQTDRGQCKLRIAGKPLRTLNSGAARRQFAQSSRIFCSRRLGRTVSLATLSVTFIVSK